MSPQPRVRKYQVVHEVQQDDGCPVVFRVEVLFSFSLNTHFLGLLKHNKVQPIATGTHHGDGDGIQQFRLYQIPNKNISYFHASL